MDTAAQQLTGPGAHVIWRGISVLPLRLGEGRGAAGWLCSWGGQRTSQQLLSHQRPAQRHQCHHQLGATCDSS